jgi:nitric oxide reductase NorD protein
MEEWVGGLWDRFITRMATKAYPAATVRLAEVEKTIGILFRGFGGDRGVRIVGADEIRHGARRRLIARIAGSGEKRALAGLDGETLRLPETLALFPDTATNRDLYLWLAALAANDRDAAAAPPGIDGHAEERWLQRNQNATLAVLSRYPGLRRRYEHLAQATLRERECSLPKRLSAAEQARETAIRAAILCPGSVATLGATTDLKPPLPVPLWLHALPSRAEGGIRKSDGGAERAAPSSSAPAEQAAHKRRQAERAETMERKSPFILPFRAESLLSWAEFVRVNRDIDDDENPDAAKAADNMDKLTLAEDASANPASRIRFDLDLPSGAEDDRVLDDGLLLPEWDWRQHKLRPDYCRLQTLQSRGAERQALPPRLRQQAALIRRQFSCLAPARSWLKEQPDGSEIDLDAWVRGHAERYVGRHPAQSASYLALQRKERDLACLVLADLSLSTDAWVSDEHRIIDVIRDSLMLFGEALAATGDRFAMYGFSSLKRSLVRFHELKTFDTAFDERVRGRIAALKPGYYTRLGAALRRATQLLSEQPAMLRPLLILSDGKPHDIDHYEGRYGIEDTRMAVIEARKNGLKPFCITVDRDGEDYLPHMFGPAGYAVVRQPEELALHLPRLYAQLTRQ